MTTPHKRLKLTALVSTIVILILIGLWQAGVFNISPRATYILQFINYKLRAGEGLGGTATKKLAAEPYYQKYSLSCEIAALKMALTIAGVNVSEDELIAKLKFDPTPKQATVWGDPHQGFVGRIDGLMPSTGFGVYAEPILDVARQYKNSDILTEATPEALAAHLLQNRPVVIWGFYGRGQKLSWTTPEGKLIKAVNGEHARTLIGFTGDIQNPTGFYLLDPRFGELYFPTDKLMENWAALNYMAVVVYP